MPPKNKKATAQKNAKKLEDKTFGLKNKKGGKNQKFIQNEQKAAGMDKGAMARAEARRIEDRKNKIEEEKKYKRQQELLKEKIQKAKEAVALKSGNPLPKEPVPEEEPEVMTVSGPSLTLTCGPTKMSAEQLAKLARKNAPKKEKVVEVVISLEELVENERAALSKKGNLTPVTVESFAAWKAKILKEKLAKEKKQLIDKKALNKKSGKEFFMQNPKMAVKDADEVEEEEVDGRIEVREKRITDEDADTLVFGDKELEGAVKKLKITKDTKGAVPPAGGE